MAGRDHVTFKKEGPQNCLTEACRAEGEDVIRANSDLGSLEEGDGSKGDESRGCPMVKAMS